MKINQVAHGFFGGLVGLAFSVPLFIHWSWTEMVKFREKKPVPRSQFYLAMALILPLSLMVGLAFPLASAAIFAYRSFKDNSLDPIAEVLKSAYRPIPESARFETSMTRASLLGFSLLSSLFSFSVINFVTDGAFGFLGVPGSALAQVLGIHSIVPLLGLTVVGSILGGLTFGLIAAGLDCFLTPRTESVQIVPSSQADMSSVYSRLGNENEEEESLIAQPRQPETRVTFLPNWGGSKQSVETEMQSLALDGAASICFDQVEPVRDEQGASVITIQKTALGTSI